MNNLYNIMVKFFDTYEEMLKALSNSGKNKLENLAESHKIGLQEYIYLLFYSNKNDKFFISGDFLK